MTALDLRTATTADADAIARIYVDGWRHAYRGLLPERLLNGMSVTREANGWRRALEFGGSGRGGLVVGPPEAPPLGFLTYGPDRRQPDRGAEIFTLYVQPDRQGQGIGRRLMAGAGETLAADGVGEVVLWALKLNTLHSKTDARASMTGAP